MVVIHPNNTHPNDIRIMKSKTLFGLPALLSLVCALTNAAPMGTAYTYQAGLYDVGDPASGIYDLRFRIYDAAVGGLQVGGDLTKSALAISNGLFTTTLDFGDAVFAGEARWLEIGVRTNGSGNFFTLSPRQPLHPAPYALYTHNAGEARTANGVSAGAIDTAALRTNAVTSSQIVDGTITAADLSLSLVNRTFWRVEGNGGTRPSTDYLGTTDDQPLELRVNNLRALRLEPNAEGAPNVVLGAAPNFIGPDVVGSTIGGGGWLNPGGTVIRNSILSSWSVIGGGLGNEIASFQATISGGSENRIEIDSNRAVIGGGIHNIIARDSEYSAIVGGRDNSIANESDGALISGGYNNSIGTDCGNSAIGGGSANAILDASRHGVIAGGYNGTIGSQSFYASIGGGQYNRIETNCWATTIAGGKDNKIRSNAPDATIGGGERNQISTNAMYSTIGGGYGNLVGTNSQGATVGGGMYNEIADSAMSTSIAGGNQNTIGERANSSVVGGGYRNNIQDKSTNAVVAGGYYNTIGSNTFFATITGGRMNVINANSGGSFIAGGNANSIGPRSAYAAVAGGWNNSVGENASSSVIGGGYDNAILNNVYYATIPGGNHNTAAGSYSLAAGNRARASHNGTFVWADSNDFDFSSTVANGFYARAVGGVKFVTGIDDAGLQTAGVRLVSGSSTWTTLSDRDSKSNFAPVDTRSVLEKLAEIPIQTWNWNAQDASIRHMGPIAQDFYAAFAVGEDEKHITTVDADGVALAAIQGLNQKVEEKEREIAELRQRLALLEQLVDSLVRETARSR